ncbi:MAG TPA: hypothetical protein VEA40_07385 [Ramlibacter sp.]|nr:hypothetical protein [Ramlibacter sp.]
MTTWINPEAAEATPAANSASQGRLEAGRPLRLGLLDNTKDNAGLLLRRIGEEVRRELGGEVVFRRKANPATAAAAELLDELARESDCVLSVAD